MKLFVASLCLLCSFAVCSTIEKKVDEVIEKLQQIVAEAQVKKTTPFDPPFSYYEQKGVYPSYIHQNLVGGPEYEILRNAIKFYDDNSFVTLWISSILLEVAHFNNNSLPSDKQLLDAIEAITTYHDKNYPQSDSILVFWPQTFNQSTGVWYCEPINLNGLAKDGEAIAKYVQKILDDIGLSKLWDKIASFIDIYIYLTKAFVIPADFDDTFINIGFGSLLKNYQTISQVPYQAWLHNNTALIHSMDALKKYAYRPFSKEIDSNLIDPRTYFYMRDFLYEAEAYNKSLALAVTWIENLSENRAQFYKDYRMPFNVNNVDLTVCANVVYGITSAVISGLIDEKEWFDDDLQMIYENTSSLIAWEIAHNLSSRPELSLTYYPALYNFYWFTSRTSNLLNTFDNLPYPVLERVKNMLSKSLQTFGSEDIVKRAIHDEDYVYFDEFLGDGDKDIFELVWICADKVYCAQHCVITLVKLDIGKPVKHGDDRISSTSMAINSLFYTWTHKRQLVKNIPADVMVTISKGCDWLSEYALSDKYKPMNAFFSGSVKTSLDFPFTYPANFIQFLNGTVPKTNNSKIIDYDLVVGVSGLIPKPQYEEMLKQKHFGYTTPLVFHGYNAGREFPFWSSDSFTYSATLLALTKCKQLIFK